MVALADSPGVSPSLRPVILAFASCILLVSCAQSGTSTQSAPTAGPAQVSPTGEAQEKGRERPSWPIAVRYEIERHHPLTSEVHRSTQEFLGASWSDWANTEVSSSRSEPLQAVSYRGQHYRAGVLEDPPEEAAQPFALVQRLRDDFPGHVRGATEFSTRGSGRPSHDPTEPSNEVAVSQGLVTDAMAPSDAFNPWFGSPWDHEDSPYSKIPDEELQNGDLFPRELGFDPEIVSNRLDIPSTEVVRYAYYAPEACTTRGQISTCERFISVAHAPSSIPLETQFIDFDGGLTTIRVDAIRFRFGR